MRDFFGPVIFAICAIVVVVLSLASVAKAATDYEYDQMVLGCRNPKLVDRPAHYKDGEGYSVKEYWYEYQCANGNHLTVKKEIK